MATEWILDCQPAVAILTSMRRLFGQKKKKCQSDVDTAATKVLARKKRKKHFVGLFSLRPRRAAALAPSQLDRPCAPTNVCPTPDSIDAVLE